MPPPAMLPPQKKDDKVVPELKQQVAHEVAGF